uniref:Inter-alpha-trypsin inhibitor heavy chain family member 6 n=1 Tax=Gouania willdenowi TaxID=441366 RepID=A0A8C5EXH9_GOUWI
MEIVRNLRFLSKKQSNKVSFSLYVIIDLTSSVLKVTDYHVKCCVVSRYAITTIQSSVWNQLPVVKEAAFEVDLPSNAFISNFTITSNGKVYVAQVTERAAARKIYDAAKKQGKTAGLVATKEREVEKFRVAVSVPSGTRMSFLLSYEELLPRRLGRYELSLGLRPGQLVPNLTVDVSITERTGISFIKVLPLKTSRLLSNNAQAEAPASTRTERSSTCARIHYSPSLQQQSSISLKGLNADFNVQYDVDLKDPMGDVQVYNGYFVHYFAPRGLPVVPKDVIFVIDVSGSMIGPKIKQTKQAMGTILGDLREGDHFNIITFSDKVHTWKKGRTVRATRQNVRDAKEFVKRIIAEGWTNINAALLSAAQLLNPPSSGRQTSHRVPLVIFLTDGEATIGVTSGDTILSNAKKSLGLASLFGLAFGDDADFLLLKRLALDNRGVARIVYEDSDAALQLKGFYDEVASPLLTDIQLSYLENQAFDVTRSMFPNYFKGSELVVTGRVKPEVKDLWVSVSASDSKQRVKFENDVLVSHAKANNKSALFDCEDGSDGISSFVHRLWAYFTIKELLLAKLNTTDPVSQRLLTEKATNLSLKYNFVTQVTSLVVVKPDADEAAQTPTTSSRPNKPKPDPPQPPFNKANTNKRPLSTPATKTLVTTSKKTTTTSSPLSLKTAPAPLSGKKPTPSQSPSKSASSPPVGKISTNLLNALKTVSPPAPGKVSIPILNAVKAPTLSTTPTTPTFSKTTTTPPPLTSLRTVSTPSPGRSSTQTVEAEESTTPAPDVHQPESSSIATTPSRFSPTPISPTPAPAPAVDNSNIKPDADGDMRIATLVSATFVPMPGVTGGPRLWEATGLLGERYTLKQSEIGFFCSFSVAVDGDPHFVVQLPKLQHNLCFTVDGRANDVLRLLEDPVRGLQIDGHLLGAPSKHGMEERSRTYFDRLTISAATGPSSDIMITLSLEGVVVEGEGRETLPINQQGSVTRQGVNVRVDNHHSCWIQLDRGVRFLVLFHQYKHPSYLQMAHLGFYITDGQGLSASTQGLLGQFQHADVSLTSVLHHKDRGQALEQGVLKWGSEHMLVTLQDKTLKDSMQKRHLGKCWVVPKAEVTRLLGHPYESYVVNYA